MKNGGWIPWNVAVILVEKLLIRGCSQWEFQTKFGQTMFGQHEVWLKKQSLATPYFSFYGRVGACSGGPKGKGSKLEGPEGEAPKRLLDFGQFDFGQLAEICRNRNWPKSRLAEVDIGREQKVFLSFAVFFFFSNSSSSFCPCTQHPQTKPRKLKPKTP